MLARSGSGDSCGQMGKKNPINNKTNTIEEVYISPTDSESEKLFLVNP